MGKGATYVFVDLETVTEGEGRITGVQVLEHA